MNPNLRQLDFDIVEFVCCSTFNVILDPNGDGIITLEEFTEPNGWGDTLVATMQQYERSG